MEKDKSRRYTLGLHVDGSRYGIVDPCVSGDESSAQHCSSEEVDGRMDMSEVVGKVEAIRGGLRIIVEKCVGGRSKSKGIVKSAIQSVQMMIRTIRNDIEEK